MNVAIKNALRGPYHASQRGLRGANKALLRGIRSAMGERAFLRLCGALAEDADRTITVDGVRFDASSPILLHRAMTWRTKEPDTIAWIDEHVRPGDVFYDVGANIGVFSLYAARKGASVVALEPFFENYAVLNRNIALNTMAHEIFAICVAGHHETGRAYLNVSSALPGKAGHAFQRRYGWNDREFWPAFRQGMIGARLIDVWAIFHLSRPNHVKIDVDGNDSFVVNGLDDLLNNDSGLRSICVELVLARECDRLAVEKIEAAGFKQRTYPSANGALTDPTKFPVNYFFVRD